MFMKNWTFIQILKKTPKNSPQPNKNLTEKRFIELTFYLFQSYYYLIII